ASAVLLATAAQIEVRHGGLLHELVEAGAPAQLRGTVRSEPAATSGDRVRVVLVVDEVRARGRSGAAAAPVLVLGGAAWQQVRYGEQVVAAGRFVATAPGDDVVALLIPHGGPHPRRPPGP